MSASSKKKTRKKIPVFFGSKKKAHTPIFCEKKRRKNTMNVQREEKKVEKEKKRENRKVKKNRSHSMKTSDLISLGAQLKSRKQRRTLRARQTSHDASKANREGQSQCTEKRKNVISWHVLESISRLRTVCVRRDRKHSR